MVTAGDLVTVAIEKPAVGGRMIGRVDGRVILVSDAIPGERVRARIERVGRGVAYAQAVAVEDASPDRREAGADPLCGGCLYAHIAYPRQLLIKADVIADAFARVGRLPLTTSVSVVPSPGAGYRMRARLHLRSGRLGFFREGTHEVCAPRVTGQLLEATCDVLDRLGAGLRSLRASGPSEIDVSENVGASERVVHFGHSTLPDGRALAALAGDGLTGLTVARADGATTILSGQPHVTDMLPVLGGRVTFRRHVLSFFQGNRHLLGDLVAHVTGPIVAGSDLVDLYAGVGLFAVSAAAVRGAQVVAVEGDRVAAQDLAANAAGSGGSVTVAHQPVEAFLATRRQAPDVLLVDPPRTGMSREALEGAVRLGARRLTYVSCDVATLARDARRIVDAGYRIEGIDAFDLFPNTPHVETVVVFTR
jgi:23S rRNA (uracil1939-C5)-methyltransferase